jgi:hypothetical protein
MLPKELLNAILHQVSSSQMPSADQFIIRQIEKTDYFLLQNKNVSIILKS